MALMVCHSLYYHWLLCNIIQRPPLERVIDPKNETFPFKAEQARRILDIYRDLKSDTSTLLQYPSI
jgi:hypothetical protein